MKATLRVAGPALASSALFLAGCSDLLTGGSKPLAVQRFVASPADVTAGASTLLTWEVVGAESIQIDNGIGVVPAKGTKQVKPEGTTTYSIAARAGTSRASASVVVSVRNDPNGPAPTPTPTPKPQPSPTPTPSPSPSPSPTPTPSPSPSPSPSPTPTPTPNPTPTPSPTSCGAPVTSVQGCAITTSKPVGLPAGECIELVALSVSSGCPLADGTSIDLGFTIKAKTGLPGLVWRRSASSADAVFPASGSVSGDGATVASLTDVVLADRVTFEVVDASGNVRLGFTLRHR